MDEFQRRVEEVKETLRRQYEEMRYGKLHRALSREGVETDLYIGLTFEMYYPDVDDPMLVLYAFDDENLLVIDQRKSCSDELKIVRKIAEGLGYRVKFFNELTPEERELFEG